MAAAEADEEAQGDAVVEVVGGDQDRAPTGLAAHGGGSAGVVADP